MILLDLIRMVKLFTITATFTEDMADSPVPQIAIAGTGIANVSATNMTKSSATEYTYSYAVPTGDGTGAITLSNGTDLAGNVITSTPTSGASFTVDNTAPTNQDTVFASSVTQQGGTTVTVVSSGDANNNIWFAPNGTASFSAGATMTTAGGTATSITAPTTEGDYRLFVIDAAGNYSSASTAVLTVDNTAPTAAITYNSTGPYKNGETVTITATFTEDMADSPVPQIAIAGTGIANVSATNMTKSSATEYTYSYAVPTGDGTGAITLSNGTDLAGNVITSTPTSGASFTVDNTAPTNQDTVFASSVTQQGGTTVTVVSSGDANNNIWFAPNGTASFSAGATMTTAGGTATSITAPTTEGDYRLFVIDAAGNYSSASTAVSYSR